MEKEILSNLKPEINCKQIWETAINFIRSQRPELETHFVKNIGFVTGLEFREPSFLLNSKNVKLLKEGMTLNLSIGFQDLENLDPEDEKNRIYALLICDTVLIESDSCRILTADAPSDLGQVSFFLRDENSSVKNKVQPQRSTSTAILKSKLRADTRVIL